MRFTVNRKVMLEYLKSMIRVVPKDNPKKELKCFLLEANEDDGFLYITATNMEVSVQRKFKPELETGGSFAIEAHLLTNILPLLGEDNVCFEEIKPGIVAIKSGRCTYKIRTLDGKNFPKPQIPFPDSTVLVSHMKQIYGKTYASVSANNVSEVLKGIHFDIKAEKLQVIGCNNQNIALITKGVSCGGEMEFTITKETFSHLATVAGNEELEVGLCGSTIVFMKDNMLFSARKIDKEFVNVNRVFENLKREYVAKVNYEEFKEQVLNICDIAAMGSQTSYIKVSFFDDKIELSTQNDTGSSSNTVSIVRVDGTANKTFYYNASSFKDVFKTVEGTLIICLNSNGYLNVMDRESQYLMMSIPEILVQKQLEKYEEKKKNPKKKKQVSAPEKKAA